MLWRRPLIRNYRTARSFRDLRPLARRYLAYGLAARAVNALYVSIRLPLAAANLVFDALARWTMWLYQRKMLDDSIAAKFDNTHQRICREIRSIVAADVAKYDDNAGSTPVSDALGRVEPTLGPAAAQEGVDESREREPENA